ncbi:hypothetical protein B0T11DRAFT_100543 [Plectosphaerella cucumerina]|uniref:Uncharacterized protein n=1 Tax=Plectosphaerella cucumerina TaxID=40658 RepID=A0A8K0TAS4_9PEZI|nr:hypothetical protein B0T11DRAFT_100543 [Plectosphaerella cucumerina]
MRCPPGHLHLHLPTLIRDDAAHLGPISRPHLFCSVVQTKVYSFTEIKLRKADILGLPSALIPPFANDGLSGARPAQASTDRPDPLDFTCDLTRPTARHVKVTSSGLLTHLLTKKCRMDSTTESPSLALFRWRSPQRSRRRCNLTRRKCRDGREGPQVPLTQPVASVCGRHDVALPDMSMRIAHCLSPAALYTRILPMSAMPATSSSDQSRSFGRCPILKVLWDCAPLSRPHGIPDRGRMRCQSAPQGPDVEKGISLQVSKCLWGSREPRPGVTGP